MNPGAKGGGQGFGKPQSNRATGGYLQYSPLPAHLLRCPTRGTGRAPTGRRGSTSPGAPPRACACRSTPRTCSSHRASICQEPPPSIAGTRQHGSGKRGCGSPAAGKGRAGRHRLHECIPVGAAVVVELSGVRDEVVHPHNLAPPVRPDAAEAGAAQCGGAGLEGGGRCGDYGGRVEGFSSPRRLG